MTTGSTGSMFKNEAHDRIISVAPKPLALVSFCCALYAIIDICRCPVRRHKVYHRLVLAMMSTTGKNFNDMDHT